jgi:hypothetical protein
MNEGRYDERLKARVEESTCLTYTGLHDISESEEMNMGLVQRFVTGCCLLQVVYYESIK